MPHYFKLAKNATTLNFTLPLNTKIRILIAVDRFRSKILYAVLHDVVFTSVMCFVHDELESTYNRGETDVNLDISCI
jgi:hypothetical protein